MIIQNLPHLAEPSAKTSQADAEQPESSFATTLQEKMAPAMDKPQRKSRHPATDTEPALTGGLLLLPPSMTPVQPQQSAPQALSLISNESISATTATLNTAALDTAALDTAVLDTNIKRGPELATATIASATRTTTTTADVTAVTAAAAEKEAAALSLPASSSSNTHSGHSDVAQSIKSTPASERVAPLSTAGQLVTQASDTPVEKSLMLPVDRTPEKVPHPAVAAVAERATPAPRAQAEPGATPSVTIPASSLAVEKNLTTDGEITRHQPVQNDSVSFIEPVAPLTAKVSHSVPASGVSVAGSLHQTPGTAAWQQELGQQLMLYTRNGIHNAELRLNPKELGALQINLRLNNDQAQLHFVTGNHQVKAALEAAMPHLRTLLDESGITLGQSSVGSDASAWNQASQQHSDASFRQETQLNRSLTPEGHAAPEIEGEAPLSASRVVLTGGVNIFA